MKKYFLSLLITALFSFNTFANTKFTLESSAFQMNSMIPDEFTCKGADKSPPLKWKNMPENTQSLALIMDDPDSSNGVWTHWILFNIPPTLSTLEAGTPVPPGAANAQNSWGGLGYRGPCPPVGVAHSYHFKLYALDTVLNFGEGSTRDLILNGMTGHVIGETELVGIYQILSSPPPAP